jgi:NAD(P)-dependent dehydrogenase (short-subunit alcohol dehydrogenase family)
LVTLNSQFDLTGRVALVTGGSKGLGKAIARGFVEAGADIVISSRSEDVLKSALDEILAGTERRGIYVVADMAKRDDVRRLAQEALEKMGKVDILVNNAGSNVPEPIDKITDENWDRLLELNLTSCMVLTRELVPAMKQRGWGRIIHMSSVLGLGGKDARNSYAATKAALIGLTRASAMDLGPHGITVNSLAPGPFMTDLPMTVLSDADKQKFSKRMAVGRWGDPREVVGPALLLASEAGSFITGTALVVDGGVLAHTL